jgi:protocadherin Fat 4
VLTNDTDVDASDTRMVTGVVAGTSTSASGSVGAAVTGMYGSINIAADGTYTFTVNNNNVAVQALRTSSDTLTDIFTYTMTDSGGLTSTTEITLTIQGANDEQVVATNAGITVAENSTGNVITTAMLQTTDDDDSAANLTYTLTSVVANGTLWLDGAALSNGSTFTQADVDSGLVSYDHDGTENFADAFSFSVDDGTGTTSTGTFTVTVTPVNDNDPTITSDGAGATASISIAENTTAVTTVTATDSDLPTQTLTYSIAGGDDAGLFTIGSSSGVLSFAAGRDFEAPTDANADGVYIVSVQVSDGTRTDTQTITVTITDVDEYNVGAVTDSDATSNTVAENSAIGTAVGLTASATDDDGTTNTITYSLVNDDGGRFTIDANTGVVTVAGAIDREADGATRSITVRATSTDTSYTDQLFTIAISDVSEAAVTTPVDNNATANSVVENASTGTVVGITAFASDADATTNGITYSLTDDAGGRFTINSSTGVVTVADGSLLDYETTTSHSITVRATSADLSTADETFAIAITDANEAGVSAVVDSNADTDIVTENVAIGTTVGVTASASDPDGTDFVTYSLTDDAGGRFAIDPNTGVVTVAGAIDREAATSYDIVIRATSSDSSFTSMTVTISISDVNESAVSTPVDASPVSNSVAENAASGTLVGIIASATDADATTNTVTYSLTDDAGGRFAIDPNTGVVTVADGSLLDFEAATSHNITIQATSSDLSTSTQVMMITLADVNEIPVAVANTANAVEAGGTGNGTAGTDPTGDVLTNDTDVDAGDTKAVIGVASGTQGITSGSVGANVAGTYGTINIAANGSYTYTVNNNNAAVQALRTPSDTLIDVFTYTMTDSGGLTSTTQITLTIQGANDEQVIATNAGITVAENSTGNVITTAMLQTTDVDDAAANLTYTLTSDVTKGTLRLNGVTLTNGSTFTQTDVDSGLVTYDHDATENFADAFTFSVDDGTGTTSTGTFTVTVAPVNDNDPTITNDGAGATASLSIAENTTAVTTVTATDSDLPAQTLTYSISGADAALFTIGSSSGVLSFAAGRDFETPTDANADGIYEVTVEVSDGTRTDTQTITVTITDVNEYNVGAVTDSDATSNTVAENSAIGTAVGLTASATDDDGTTNTITYSLVNDDGGRFTIDANTGVVTVAGAIDREADGATRSITVRATSTDTSYTDQLFTIAISDVSEAAVTTPVDNNVTANSVVENASTGTVVGITALASDADATTNAITYSLINDAGGRFTINSSTGVVTVADGSLLDYETTTSHSITVRATSADLSTADETFVIATTDANEAGVSAVVDSDAATDIVTENVAIGATVGITASASDPDGTDTVTYSLADDAVGRFAIDPNTGVVTVAGAIDREDAASYDVTIRATSSDTSFTSLTVTINIVDVNEFSTGTVSDNNAVADSVTENAAVGTTVGITALAIDADATTNLVTYTLQDDDGGRFAINSSTGVVTVAGAIDRETDGATRSVTVRATSVDGSFTDQSFTIAVVDADEFPVTTPADTDATTNAVDENVVIGTVVGITASANDADSTTNTVIYSLFNNDGGNFAIDASSGVVTTAALLNREALGATRSITVRATSADGSHADQIYTIAINDLDEFDVTAIVDANNGSNEIYENASTGTVAGIVAFSEDPDATTNSITYSLTDDAGGRFAIDSSTGVITVAGAIDRETDGPSLSITVRATGMDGSTSDMNFTISILDEDEFDVTAVADMNNGSNEIDENSAVGATVNLIAFAKDLDATTNAITYSLTNNDVGRFAIDSVTGVVAVAGAINRETDGPVRSITIRATSADASFTEQRFAISRCGCGRI